jgi:hypothetical protein
MNIEIVKQEIVPKYISSGEQKFYRSIIFLALQKLIATEKGIYNGTPPHLEYLEYHETFLILYRREGDDVYLQIARMLRKAAHKIYRIMLKKNMTVFNSKFLNLV